MPSGEGGNHSILDQSPIFRQAVPMERLLTKRDVQSIDFKQYLTNAGVAVGTASAIESAIVLTGN